MSVVSERNYRASMDVAATPEETAAVPELLDELGLGIQVRSDHTDRGAIETLPWTLAIAVPVTTFLSAFTKKFGERAADASADAIDAAAKLLRRWIVRLYESRRPPQGVLILTDRDRGLDIVMPRDLSPDAYRQLTQILEALPSGMANRPSELRWTGVRWVQQAL